MAGMLRDCLEALPESGWLCWYGDHVPIMSKVYRGYGCAGRANRLPDLGKRRPRCDGVSLDMEVENLGSLLLTKMGLIMLH